MEPGLRRIAYVTRYYEDLRGGVTRAAAAPVLLVAGWSLSLSGHFSGWAVAVAVGVLLGVISRCVHRWLDLRFGRVVGASSRGQLVIVAPLLLFAAIKVGHAYPESGPAALFLWMSAFGLYLTVRLWPYGAMNLLPTLVGIAAAVDLASVTSRESLVAWEARAYTSVLAAWTIAGLFDLGLLTKMLPAGRSGEANAGERA